MKFKNQNFVAEVRILAVVVVFICGLQAVVHAAKYIPSDELLDESLGELTDMMDEAHRGNRIIKSDSRNLQHRIDLLEDVLADLEREKASLKREAARVSDTITIDMEIEALNEKRLKNYETRKARLTEEQERIKAKVANRTSEIDKAKGSIDQLDGEIEQMTSQLKGMQDPQTGGKKEKNPAKRTDLTRTLAVQEKKVADLERQLNQKKQSLKRSLQGRTLTRGQGASLQDEIAAAEEQLQKEKDKVRLLNRERKAAMTMGPRSGSQIEQDVNELEAYAAELESTLAGLKTASRSVKQNDQQTKELTTYAAQLNEDNQALKARLRTMGETPAANTNDEVMAASDGDFDEKRNALLAKQDVLREKIMNTKASLQDAAAEERSAKPSVNKANEKLMSSLDESRDRVADLKEEIASAKANSVSSGSNQKVDNLEKKLQKLQKEQDALKDEYQALSGPNQVSASVLKEEIESLKSRQAVLVFSLNQIRERYASAEFPASKFAKEETELREYLETLRRENGGLQERLLTIMMKQENSSPDSPQ